MAQLVGNIGSMGLLLLIGLADGLLPMPPRPDLQHCLHGKRAARMVSFRKRLIRLIVVFPPLPPFFLLSIQLAPHDEPTRPSSSSRHARRHGTMDPAERSFPPKQDWKKNEGAVVALDPTPATPWNLYFLVAQGGNWRNCIVAISLRLVVVGRVGD